MKKQGILLIDDDCDYREHLEEELRADYGTVVGAETGEEAIKILSEDPSRFQFAVVDHQLGKGLNGIETTEKLVNIAPRIYPVIFSNVPVDTSPEIIECKFKALEAGAYRYLEWNVYQKDRKKDIHDFVSEIEQLTSLRDWISNFFEARAAAPSLLTQLNIGMDIIDRHFKVWFMNERMREIIGLIGPDLPKKPCSHWHDYPYCPCPGCLVNLSLTHGISHEKIFLRPLPFRDKERVFFLKVWAQPVTNAAGEIVKTPDGRPLAVMESVQDLTDSLELKAIPLSKRLQIIAEATLGITLEKYTEAHLFQYCRVYQRDPSTSNETFILKAAAGIRVPPKLDITVNIHAFDPLNLLEAEINARETGYGYSFIKPTGYDLVLPGLDRLPYIYIPIIENNRTIALLEVGCDKIKLDTAALLKPYAHEVLRATQDDRARIPEHIVLASAQVSKIEQSLQTQTTPESQLQIIVKQVCELTDSQQYVIRYVDGSNAKLIRLKIPNLCAYENVVNNEYQLSYEQSWSCRTITARAETLVDIVVNENIIKTFREKLSEESREVLKDANALCYEPLILDGVCIGVLGLHSKITTNYRDERKIAVIRDLAKRATMALHDYIVEQKSIEKAESDALSDILGLVLHNIKTPLATAGIVLTMLETQLKDQGKLLPDMQDLIDGIKNQLLKISRIRDDVLNLKRPTESRKEIISLSDYLKEIVTEIVTPVKGVKVNLEYVETLKIVSIDKAGLKLCLEVLLDNAMDAVKENEGDKRIRIVVRFATDKENRMIESALPGLAFDIEDNGPGVSSDMKPRLFKKMSSSKNTGLGMGLIHCRVFALSAQGNVYYDNTYEQGARFTLVFPYYAEKETCYHEDFDR